MDAKISFQNRGILWSISNTTEESRLCSTYGMYIGKQILLDFLGWYRRIFSVRQLHRIQFLYHCP